MLFFTISVIFMSVVIRAGSRNDIVCKKNSKFQNKVKMCTKKA